MELLKVSQLIEDKINELTMLRSQLALTAESKSQAITHYEKVLAKTMIALRNGETFDLEGDVIKDPPISIIDKLTKGICWNEKLDADKSESKYKNLLVSIDIVKCQVLALQSIFRNLSHV